MSAANSPRSAEFPDIIVQPQMRFMPSTIPPPQAQSSAKALPGPITKVPKAANPNAIQRRPSLTAATPPNQISGPYRSPVIQKPLPVVRRRTIDIKVPGAFVEYRISVDNERKLEEHAKKIDAEFAAIAKKEQKKRPVRLPSGPFEQLYSSNPLDSRTRYHEQRQNAAESHHQRRKHESVQARNHSKINKVKPLRRLSLEDFSSDMGSMFGEIQGRRVGGGNIRTI
jgi:hypothetical protein